MWLSPVTDGDPRSSEAPVYRHPRAPCDAVLMGRRAQRTVIYPHAGSRAPVLFFIVVFLLCFPRAFTSSGVSRWAWLALGVCAIAIGGRGMFVGRVTGDRSTLTVWAAFRRRHFDRTDIVGVRTDHVRLGLAGVRREALVVELSTRIVMCKDINVPVGSGGLGVLCSTVNDWLLVQASAQLL